MHCKVILFGDEYGFGLVGTRSIFNNSVGAPRALEAAAEAAAPAVEEAAPAEAEFL